MAERAVLWAEDQPQEEGARMMDAMKGFRVPSELLGRNRVLRGTA